MEYHRTPRSHVALDHHLGYPSTIEVVRMDPMAGIKVTGLAALAGMGILAGTKAAGMETLAGIHPMDTIPGTPRLAPIVVEAETLLIMDTEAILPTTIVTEEVAMV